MFKNLVLDCKELSKVQKLYYLKNALIGKASELLADTAISETAYQEAWMNLCERYHNKRAIIRACLSDFFEIQKLKKNQGCVGLLDCVDRILRGLKAVGEPVDS